MSCQLQRALFAGGCFTTVAAFFSRLPGVVEARSGFCGGTTGAPTYAEVCSGRSDYVETVEVRFDPQRVSYPQLLEAFWQIHDPTSALRQGPDCGNQYRAVIFVLNREQRLQAEASRTAEMQSGRYPRPIVTAIEAAGPFYPATLV